MEPTWHNFPDFLAAEFPELSAAIDSSYYEWLSAFTDPYPHVFLEEFIGPILLGTSEITEAAVRTHAGQVLDRLLLCQDHDLASAALTSVIEPLNDHPKLRAAAWPFLGETAREWLLRLVAPADTNVSLLRDS